MLKAMALAALVLATVPLFAAGCHEPPAKPYTPGLGEIMTLTQMRHLKLWLAGAAENWRLADYELDELEEGFEDVVRFHARHKDARRPLTELVPEFTDLPLRSLRSAVADEDFASFSNAYDSLTAGCNGCHRATGFSFNVVSRPTSNPYTNQEFRASP
jgi:hypothetical protein